LIESLTNKIETLEKEVKSLKKGSERESEEAGMQRLFEAQVKDL
tara:strand:- start:67 stop:198 length:132 start_codon:yes stop_codon:yes gene_type:complete